MYRIKLHYSIFLLLYVLSVSVINAQSYFNKILDYSVPTGIEYRSFCHEVLGNGNIVIPSNGFLGSFNNKETITVLDPLGNTISKTDYIDSINRFNIGGIVQFNDTTLFLVGNVFAPNAVSGLYIASISTTGQLKWDSIYFSGSSNYEFGNDIIVNSERNIVVCGTILDTTDFLIKPRILSIDSTGVILFDSLYIGYGNNLGNHWMRGIAEDKKGGYAITGQILNKLYVLKVDSIGTLFWDSLYYNNLTEGEGNDIIAAKGGGFYIAGGQAIDTILRAQGLLMKIDSDGNVLWKKDYGDSVSNVFLGLTETADSNLVAVGYYDPEESLEWDGWINKVSGKDGKLIWERKVVPDSTEISDNYLFDVHVFSDGGILASGFIKGDLYNPWIVRLDQCGCDSIHCYFLNQEECIQGVGIEESIVQNYMQIYPNPSKGAAMLVYNLGDSKIGQLIIIDGLGRPINQITLPTNQAEGRIMLPKLPKGMFFVRMMIDGQVVHSEKLVRQ